ncbi:MAG TPA: hypothetical protein VLT34_18150 [Arthrobacter sp.]|nr:hypothetical protein [Arthrobacter sp.]
MFATLSEDLASEPSRQLGNVSEARRVHELLEHSAEKGKMVLVADSAQADG